jgi:hypothetical protein
LAKKKNFFKQRDGNLLKSIRDMKLDLTGESKRKQELTKHRGFRW